MLIGVAALGGLGLTPPAAALPGVCTGHFVNPITDICWGCLFPLSVGGLSIWPSPKAQAHDLESFSAEAGRRGEAVRQQALDTRTAAQANRALVGSVKTGGAKGSFDFDAMIAGADAAAAGSKLERPKLIVFASLSMPVPSLKSLVRDTTKAGGVVVFRGFKNGSVKDFMAGLAPVFDKGQKVDGVGIDPRLFRAFSIEAVPTYVVTAGDVDPCDGFYCTTSLPPYDRLAGNVTTEYALSTIADGRGPGSAAAKVYLGRLRRGDR